MGLALRMSRKQLLLLVLVLLCLFVTALLVVHAALPHLWQGLTDLPNVISRWP